MQASTWICKNQMQTNKVHQLAPPTCVLYFCPRILIHHLFFSVASSLSMSMQLLIFSSFVVQLLPWSYLCSKFSPFVINFHKRYVIPIKSLDINWKSVNLIVTKDCIGIDGWGLNLVFFMDITICVGMTLLELLLRYHIWSLTLIPFGGALPLCHIMGHSIVNLFGEGTFFAWWSLKVEDHLWNHLLVW